MGKDRGQSSIVLLPNLARSGSALPRNRLGLVRRDWGQSYSEIARVFGGSSVAAGVPRGAVPRDCEGNERGKTCLTPDRNARSRGRRGLAEAPRSVR